MVAAAVILQLLIVIGALYDTARLLAPAADRRPPCPRLWQTALRSQSRARPPRRRAELEAAERRLVAQRLRGEIDAAPYRAGMRSLADGHRTPASGRDG
ncbi:SHOCT domain-containing protein OS=Streptomyces aurantiogriseus OX=66870 GN=GCM10010251_58710 PE=4 SV=1 [Streptomyces aurantiogriseus]|uniref:Uncharacterized protein n=1 Tax=Streptomyces aurantiogriseus TaxID=66870 RepID=A0A918FFI9_9ACTN|nr:hypothetical protein GCM10010251_58710 [Streptomyces aurantiogriseus]